MHGLSCCGFQRFSCRAPAKPINISYFVAFHDAHDTKLKLRRRQSIMKIKQKCSPHSSLECFVNDLFRSNRKSWLRFSRGLRHLSIPQDVMQIICDMARSGDFIFSLFLTQNLTTDDVFPMVYVPHVFMLTCCDFDFMRPRQRNRIKAIVLYFFINGKVDI